MAYSLVDITWYILDSKICDFTSLYIRDGDGDDDDDGSDNYYSIINVTTRASENLGK